MIEKHFHCRQSCSAPFSCRGAAASASGLSQSGASSATGVGVRRGRRSPQPPSKPTRSTSPASSPRQRPRNRQTEDSLRTVLIASSSSAATDSLRNVKLRENCDACTGLTVERSGSGGCLPPSPLLERPARHCTPPLATLATTDSSLAAATSTQGFSSDGDSDEE